MANNYLYYRLFPSNTSEEPHLDLARTPDAIAPKRGPGRPPKRKSYPQSGEVQLHNGDMTADLNNVQAKRPVGRPRKNGAPATIQGAPVALAGRRPRGRPRKTESVGRRRGRPKRVVDSGAAGEDEASVVELPPPKKRGRPPKIGGAVSKPMKPVRRTGRPVGRPRKHASAGTTEAPRVEVADYGKLKRKYELLQGKVKEAVKMLKATALALEKVTEQDI